MKPSKLEKFLINRNLLECFQSYYNVSRGGTSYKQYLKYYSSRNDAIDMAFIWSATPQGQIFWEKIHSEWHRCLKGKII